MSGPASSLCGRSTSVMPSKSSPRALRAPADLSAGASLRYDGPAIAQDRGGQPLPDAARPCYRLLALDVDGTLLDPAGTLRPRTAEALARAAAAGIRPVLCTGRRYRRAFPVAHELGLDA